MSPFRVEPEYVSIPKELIESNKSVTLSADIMSVNHLPFVVTYGEKSGINDCGVDTK